MSEPEPEWWAVARRLRAEGWKLEAIAAQCNRHVSTVQYAVNQSMRDRKRVQRREFYLNKGR